MDYFLHIVHPGNFENILCAKDVDIIGKSRLDNGAIDMDLCGKVKNGIHITHNFFKEIVIPDIPMDQFKVPEIEQMTDIHQVSIHKIIETEYCISVFCVLVTEMRTDKTCPTGYKYFHRIIASPDVRIIYVLYSSPYSNLVSLRPIAGLPLQCSLS